MTQNTSTNAEAEKLYASKETQCNLIGKSLYDRNAETDTSQAHLNKNDNYWTEIRGDVSELNVGPQFYNEGTVASDECRLQPVTLNISFHGATFNLDPYNSTQIISRSPEIISYTQVSNNRLALQSMQKKVEEEKANTKSCQETSAESILTFAYIYLRYLLFYHLGDNC